MYIHISIGAQKLCFNKIAYYKINARLQPFPHLSLTLGEVPIAA